MSNDKLKQLIETLASIGYEIGEFDDLYDRGTERFYGDTKILICPISKPKNPLSKEIIIKLTETLSSVGYGIVEYKLLCGNTSGNIFLELQTL